jgi:hypothetical protein
MQKRADAEAGLKALDGLVLHGMEMKIGWGKAVPLPPVPLYSGHGVPTGPLTGRENQACCMALCRADSTGGWICLFHVPVSRAVTVYGSMHSRYLVLWFDTCG